VACKKRETYLNRDNTHNISHSFSLRDTAWAYHRSNWKGRTNGLLRKSGGTILITSAGDSESLVTLIVHVYSTLSLQINKVMIKSCKPWLHTYFPVMVAMFPGNTGYVPLIHCRGGCVMFFMCTVWEVKSQREAVYICSYKILQQLLNTFP
jgi:hypothetical protein